MLLIPDTNFLIYLSKYKLWDNLTRFYGRYDLIILPEVVYELEELIKKSKGKERQDVLLTLEVIKTRKVKSKKGYADEAIIKISDSLKKINKKNYVIATMDKELIKKIKKQNIKVLTIRQKKYFVEK